jgi:hypothetical protein
MPIVPRDCSVVWDDVRAGGPLFIGRLGVEIEDLNGKTVARKIGLSRGLPSMVSCAEKIFFFEGLHLHREDWTRMNFQILRLTKITTYAMLFGRSVYLEVLYLPKVLDSYHLSTFMRGDLSRD